VIVRVEPQTSSEKKRVGKVRTFEGRLLANPDEDIFDQGLAFDLETVIGRRRMLQLLGTAGIGAGLFALAGCLPAASGSATATSSASASGSASSSSTASSAAADCEVIPEETAGPYPGDGSNGPDVLNQSGIVRSDIRSSFGTATGVAQGVPLTIRVAIQDVANGCAPLAGAAVYLWHCTREGQYSLYSQGVANENFLRGVQAAGNDGVVTFQSIFPGCYRPTRPRPPRSPSPRTPATASTRPPATNRA
jgi:protocatechuate 3,4-dioxygenase beta subunit